MSGFVGIVNVDGTPIDRQLLRGMTEFLAFRGPDRRDVWVDNHVGFGHALLATTPEPERQPRTLDGSVWIVGDLRLDGRADLVRTLQAAGRDASDAAPDIELVLHAFHAWGEDCLHHLRGDFSCALWDGPAKRLFCGRDHFGVRPLYYAETRRGLVFSNTLRCLRLHPEISDELNELAIGDFLMFGSNQDAATTTFAGIRRLPPAHLLTASEGAVRLRRYWTLPIGPRIQYRRSAEYVEHFRDLWRTAVGDRLRSDRVGVLMSGGLDSTSVALTAHDLAARRPHTVRLTAHTVGYERLIPDDERQYATLAAQVLGTALHYLALDDYKLFTGCEESACQMPEPSDNPTPAATLDLHRQIARCCRVALSGYGGDPALSASPGANLISHLAAGRAAALVADVMCCLAHGLRPPLGIRAALGRWRGRAGWQPLYPSWIAPEFADRLGLRERWQELRRQPAALQPHRMEAARELTSPFWSSLFEMHDPGVTGCPVVFGHPFFDVRLLTYLFAVPPVPWFLTKKLLRDAMRGKTPETVRRRPKAPLAVDPIWARLRLPQAEWINTFDAAPELLKYVEVEKIPKVAGLRQQLSGYEAHSYLVTRPLCLNLWLRHAGPPTLPSLEGTPP